MDRNVIHETEISSILDIVKNGVHAATGALRQSKDIGSYGSIAKAAQGLTLVFPVLISNSLPIEFAATIQKAIERKEVALLQMLFSAYNITNAKDTVSYLAKFHTNMGTKMDLDKFIDIMDSLTESYSIPRVPTANIRAIAEDCKRNISYTFESDFNTTSLLEFCDIGKNGNTNIIHEYIRPRVPSYDPETGKRLPEDHPMTDDDAERMAGTDMSDSEKLKYYINQRNKEQENEKRKAEEDERYRQQRADDMDKIRRETPVKMLLPSEIKKANEMQPTLMVVNFFAQDENSNLNVVQQAVAGVKAKLYGVDSSDIVNKLVQKGTSGDVLLKFVQLSSREISVIKDFILGIDDAKLSAVTRSKKGAGSRLFDALERRSSRGKIRKAFKLGDCYKAITTLVISEEEAQMIKKVSLLDCHMPTYISPIMEKLNLLHFIIVDTTSETIQMLTDGDTEFETYAFSSLSKEAADNSYKKIVNLITKLA